MLLIYNKINIFNIEILVRIENKIKIKIPVQLFRQK